MCRRDLEQGTASSFPMTSFISLISNMDKAYLSKRNTKHSYISLGGLSEKAMKRMYTEYPHIHLSLFFCLYFLLYFLLYLLLYLYSIFRLYISIPPHIIKCFLLKIQGFSTFYISVNRPQLQAFPCIGY